MGRAIGRVTQTGERGRTAADVDGIRAPVREEAEEEEEEPGEEKGRAGPPRHPASPPALSPKPHQLKEAK